MNILSNDIKRRRAFIAEICLLKEMDEKAVEYLREKAEQGRSAFWEAVCSICGERAGEYILKIAERSVERVEAGLAQMEGHEFNDKQEDPGLSMLRWYMVGVSALELAQCESQELYSSVKAHVERALACLAIITPIGSGPAQ